MIRQQPTSYIVTTKDHVSCSGRVNKGIAG
jgi:hypothetical protein